MNRAWTLIWMIVVAVLMALVFDSYPTEWADVLKVKHGNVT